MVRNASCFFYSVGHVFAHSFCPAAARTKQTLHFCFFSFPSSGLKDWDSQQHFRTNCFILFSYAKRFLTPSKNVGTHKRTFILATPIPTWAWDLEERKKVKRWERKITYPRLSVYLTFPLLFLIRLAQNCHRKSKLPPLSLVAVAEFGAIACRGL
jgi:hypothetical protein